MFCRYCGKEFNGNFCPACGAKAEPVQPPMPQPPVQPQKPEKKSKAPIIILIVVLCVALIGAGAFFLLMKNRDVSEDTDEKTSVSETTDDFEITEEPETDELPEIITTNPDLQNISGVVDKGTQVDINTYKNSTLGIRITCPDNWVFYDDEQLAGLSENVQDYTSLDTPPNIMFASDLSGSSINIVANKTLMSTLSDELFDELIDEVKTQYSDLGIEIKDITRSDKTIDGIDFYGIKFTASVSGQSVEMYQLFKLVDGVQYVITITCFPTQDMDFILGFIKALS